MKQTNTTFRVWGAGKSNIMQLGQKVFVGKCGSGTDVYGEYAFLKSATKCHLVFETESGSIIKTSINNLYIVAGRMGKEGWFVSPIIDRDGKFYRQRVYCWNEKNNEMCYK